MQVDVKPSIALPGSSLLTDKPAVIHLQFLVCRRSDQSSV